MQLILTLQVFYNLMMVRIVNRDHAALRKGAGSVPEKLFGSAKLRTILKNMKRALAAPQIGLPLRIFVVSPNAYLESERDIRTVFINPRLLRVSKRTKKMEEGCLSVRWLYGEVTRAAQATVEAYDEHGKKFARGAGGLLAQIFQHELDHLDGVLFIDKAKNIREIPPHKDD